jgi:hypothetical protein
MDVLSRNVPAGIEKYHETAGFPAEIRTHYFQNRNLKRYHQTNFFGQIYSRKIITN